MTGGFRLLLVLYFAVFLISVPGCRRKEPSAGKDISAANTGGKSEVSADKQKGKQKLVFGTLKKKNEPAESVREPVTELDPGDYSVLLASVSSLAVLPSDTVIGELQDPSALDPDEEELYRNVESFFKGLASGSVEENFLSPVSRNILAAGLKKYEFPADMDVRIGVFRYRDNYIEMAVRFISDKGRASGTVVAENIEGTWLISSISADFGLLEKEYRIAEKKFDPDSYPNLDLEY